MNGLDSPYRADDSPSSASRSTSVLTGRVAQILFAPAFPGLAIGGALFTALALKGTEFDYAPRSTQWQYLDESWLASNFWGSVTSLHTQPAGFNFLLGIVDRFSGYQPGIWQFLNLTFTLGAIALTAQGASVLSGSKLAGRLAGTALALLPATYLFSFWLFYTPLCAFLIAVMAWSLSVLPKLIAQGRRTAFTATVFGLLAMTCLFLTRASFIWCFALLFVGCIFLLWFSSCKARRHRIPISVLALLAGMTVGIAGVQGAYVVRFDIWTQSSWSGMNLVNAVQRSPGTPHQLFANLADADPCFNYLLTRKPFAQTPPSPTDLESLCGPASSHNLSNQDSEALQRLDRQNGQYNLNNRYELALAPYWQGLAREIVWRNPEILWTIPWGTDGSDGTLAIFLSRSEDYWLIYNLLDSWPRSLDVLLAYSAIAPIVFVPFGVIPTLVLLTSRHTRRRIPINLAVLVFFTVVLAAAALLGEYGENQRFRAEMEPLWIIGALSSSFLAMRLVRSGSGSRKQALASLLAPALAALLLLGLLSQNVIAGLERISLIHLVATAGKQASGEETRSGVVSPPLDLDAQAQAISSGLRISRRDGDLKVVGCTFPQASWQSDFIWLRSQGGFSLASKDSCPKQPGAQGLELSPPPQP